jgi:5-methylcytosine-specific restriction endonuclease McrA
MNEHGAKWIRPAKRAAIYARDGRRCAYCLAPALPRPPEPILVDVEYVCTLTLDHLIPRELGGTNDASNLVTACFSCNSARQDRTLRSWFKTLRARGVQTDRMGARIRRLIKKPLVERTRSR